MVKHLGCAGWLCSILVTKVLNQPRFQEVNIEKGEVLIWGNNLLAITNLAIMFPAEITQINWIFLSIKSENHSVNLYSVGAKTQPNKNNKKKHVHIPLIVKNSNRKALLYLIQEHLLHNC